MGRNPLGLFFAVLHKSDRPPRSIEPRERCFLPFVGNGRDHDGKPERHDARDPREDKADASQNPGKRGTLWRS